jgi:hypothetical protein
LSRTERFYAVNAGSFLAFVDLRYSSDREQFRALRFQEQFLKTLYTLPVAALRGLIYSLLQLKD